MRAGQVALDLADRPLLRAGQLVVQRVVETPNELAPHDMADAALVPLERALAHDEDHLDPEKLVERQPPPRLLLLGHRLR
jgi:hypothetical protein